MKMALWFFPCNESGNGVREYFDEMNDKCTYQYPINPELHPLPESTQVDFKFEDKTITFELGGMLVYDAESDFLRCSVFIESSDCDPGQFYRFIRKRWIQDIEA